MELSDNFPQGRRCTRSFSQAPGDDGSLDQPRLLTVSKVSAEARANLLSEYKELRISPNIVRSKIRRRQ